MCEFWMSQQKETSHTFIPTFTTFDGWEEMAKVMEFPGKVYSDNAAYSRLGETKLDFSSVSCYINRPLHSSPKPKDGRRKVGNQ